MVHAPMRDLSRDVMKYNLPYALGQLLSLQQINCQINQLTIPT